MLRLFRHLLTVALLVLLAGATFAGEAKLFVDHSADLASEARAAAGERRILAVLFEQEGCSACVKQRRQVFSDASAARRFAAGFRTLAVDLASEDESFVTPDGRKLSPRQWAERLRIPGTPALAFFDGAGNILYRHVGALADAGELSLLARYVDNGEYERLPFAAYARQAAARRSSAAVNNHLDGSICRTRS
jgi:thioredoxin-related protein